MDVSAAPVVRNDYLQALHYALLRTCGVAGTRRFWLANPLRYNGLELSPGALGRHLADPAKTSPLAWLFHSQNALESFLLDYGVSIDVFFDSLLHHANRASFVHSRTGLAWVSPLLGLVFRVADPYRALIKLAKLAGRSISPSMTFREFGLQKHADGRRRILVLTTRNVAAATVGRVGVEGSRAAGGWGRGRLYTYRRCITSATAQPG